MNWMKSYNISYNLVGHAEVLLEEENPNTR